MDWALVAESTLLKVWFLASLLSLLLRLVLQEQSLTSLSALPEPPILSLFIHIGLHNLIMLSSQSQIRNSVLEIPPFLQGGLGLSARSSPAA